MKNNSQKQALIAGLLAALPVAGSLAQTYSLEAEDFTSTGGTFAGFQTYTNSNASGGQAANFIQTGDWANYSLTLPSDGFYTIRATVATPMTTARLKFSIGSWNVADVPVSSTGGWGAYETITVATGVYMTGQTHTLRFEGAGVNWEWNADKFEVVREGTGTSVNINLDVKHSVGTYEDFDRTRFMTIHATNTENDWFGGNPQSLNQVNEEADLLDDLMVGRDLYFGRDTGGMAWQLSQAPEDSNKTGWADSATLQTNGNGARWIYSNTNTDQWNDIRAHEGRNQRLIVGAQQRPYWPDGNEATGQGWFFSQTDTTAEPLGTSVGHFMGHYVNKFFKPAGSTADGQTKPKFVEVMNEPLFDLVEFPHHAPATIPDIMNFHNAVANEIREHDSDVLIGGYTTAFPNYEVDNFSEWDNTDKLFMNTAGWNMDFISIHLYDFPNIPYTSTDVREQYRKGSNMEATLDMLDAFMDKNWGNKLPIVISEYGSQLQGSFNEPWTAERDWFQVKAFSAQLMQFLERPDRISQAIPFIPLKAEWGRIDANTPYYWRLMIQKKERPGQSGDEWVYSDLIHFYDLWKDVSGTRVDTWAEDQDIQVDAYVNDKKVYFIANSLEFTNTELDLSFLGANGNSVSNVTVRHVYQNSAGGTQFDENNLGTSLPSSVTLNAEATMVVIVEYANTVSINHSSEESKYFATTMTQDISANTTMNFAVNGLTVASNGEAILRLGIGRDFGKSITPTVEVNGTAVTVPTDFRGYDQFHNGSGRDSFFGVIEIPVPYSAIQADNTVSVTFPDAGGKVSSVAIQNFEQSKAISRN